MTGVQTCALPICFPVTILPHFPPNLPLNLFQALFQLALPFDIINATNPLSHYATPNNASDETILALDAGDLLGVSLSHADLGGLYTVNVTVFTI